MDYDKKSLDRRVIKTKKAIRNAFAELLSEKDLNDITIKDIADRADINRKTFYNYYSGVYQVVEEIENEIVELFKGTLKDVDFAVALKQPYLLFGRLTDVINSDLDFYGHLFRAERNSNLSTKVARAMMKAAKNSFSSQTDLDEETLDIVINYTISGMFGVYQSWFNSDRHQSVEEISRLISRLCVHGLNGLNKEGV